MKIGYTLWTWNRFLACEKPRRWDPISPYTKRDFENGLKQISHLRYQTVENFNFIMMEYEDNPEEFKQLIKKYNLEFVNLYNYLTDNFDEDIKMTERCIKFINYQGAEYMNLEPPKRFDKQVNEDDVKEMARRANILGKMCKDNGITLCLHPHIGTYVYYENEIDTFVENTDPELVSLCLDTAHTVLAGMDPVKLFDRLAHRIKYVHFKDVDSVEDVKTPNDRFRALGLGIVDFVGVYNVLKKHGYDGIICIELDNPPICHYQSAQVTREYLRNVFNL